MFVSYAQNSEDVLLWRALSHVDQGFYIDVGASDPEEHSVTRAFYERSWSGVNVEPLEVHIRRLREMRHRDINLQAVVGGAGDEVRFFEILGADGLSTTNEEMAARYSSSGIEVSERLVPRISLTEIFANYGQRDVHFLKIDVEGAEKEVLASGDFRVNRPWIIVIEAVEPFNSLTGLTSTQTYFERARRSDSDWDEILLQSDYERCFFDGVNSYFVAKEHIQSIGPKLAIPANVLDDAVPAELARLREERLALTAELGELSRYAELVGQAVRAMSEAFYSTTEFFGQAEAARLAMEALLNPSGGLTAVVEGGEIDR